MIYWFSGTGNSKYVAEQLSVGLGDKMQSIVDAVNHGNSGDFGDESSVGFVFPIYSWGVPPIVIDFIDKIDSRILQNKYIYAVVTCGDEVAKAPEMIRKSVRKKGVEVAAIYSVIMPNNYVLLPGFSVDSEEVEQCKLNEAPARIATIVESIESRKIETDVVRGSMAWLKSTVVYPLFKRWGVFPEKWKSTEQCISCGKCVKACPVGNITLECGRPHWGKNCTSCVACYHVCPTNAVQYGRATRGKGQYRFHLSK